MEEEIKALQIRFPITLYNQLTERAAKSRRSLNAEVIVCLEEYLSGLPYILQANETLKQMIEMIGDVNSVKAKPK